MRQFKLLLLLFCVGLYSCSADTLPDKPEPPIAKVKKGRYLIHWESNQGGAYLKVILYPNYKSIVTIDNIQDSDYEIDLESGDTFTFGICYKEAYLRPELYMAVYVMNPVNGKYSRNNVTLLYEKEVESNAFGFNGFINRNGGIN